VNPGESSTEVRVRYAETDQMGFAHHANYLLWCEVGRTHHMREQGVSYRELEGQGIRLPVVSARLRYRASAKYDDVIRIRSWVRDSRSRRVEFGNAIERADDGVLLATAEIVLMALDASNAPATLPPSVRERLVAIPDPVRL
jgi:acyl-CoA thioester hydrolase